MPNSGKIIIYEPEYRKTRKYFSINIKSRLENENFYHQMPAKMFVLSGIEHNFHSLVTLLQKAHVINENYRWIFKDGHLVILGHLSSSSECLWLLYGLESRASRKGGYIHYLPEDDIESLSLNWLKEAPNYALGKKTSSSSTILFDGNMELRRWLLTKKRTISIGNFHFVCGTGQAIRSCASSKIISSEMLNKAEPFWIIFGNLETFTSITSS